MILPGINRKHVVTTLIGKQPRIDRAHRPDTDNCDPHQIYFLQVTCPVGMEPIGLTGVNTIGLHRVNQSSSHHTCVEPCLQEHPRNGNLLYIR